MPTTDLLLSRGMMGDGVIELRRLRTAVDAAGYAGPIEVEIFNQAIWEMPGGEVLRLMQMRMSDACTFWGYDISPQAIENPQGQLRNSGWPKQIHECCYYHNANGYLKKDGTEA